MSSAAEFLSLYIAKDEKGRLKIGITKNDPAVRVRSIQGPVWCRVSVVTSWAMPTLLARQAEKAVKEHFKSRRAFHYDSEWFKRVSLGRLVAFVEAWRVEHMTEYEFERDMKELARILGKYSARQIEAYRAEHPFPIMNKPKR